jgi:hypothetical protein
MQGVKSQPSAQRFLEDFPEARVHVMANERAAAERGGGFAAAI